MVIVEMSLVSSSPCPDPFEERHPCRVDPECQLGMILKAYFKKETLVSEVFSSYMRENYFTRSGLDQSSFQLNVQACRLVLDILPGLEVAVLNETDGLVTQVLSIFCLNINTHIYTS